jgi:FO synthase
MKDMTRVAAALVDADAKLLMRRAAALRDEGHGGIVSYSRKAFIPLTQLCRDVCAYCTFATTPKKVKRAYLIPDEVLEIATAGGAAGCKEALFTLGDKPELRFVAAREELAALGYETTISYLAAMANAGLGTLPGTAAEILDDEVRPVICPDKLSTEQWLSASKPPMA